MTGNFKSEKFVLDDEMNIVLCRSEGGLEDLNLSLVPSRVEQSFSLDLICLGT